MIELNLTAKGKEQTLIKDYLEQNVSESLAEKINNGITIIKENKILLSKKDLAGFMKFANEEAKKLAEKGANYACVEDSIVFGWAIHYFEEDTIEGTLYNEDGTEYKPTPKITTTPKVEVKQETKKENTQASLFDFMDLSENPQTKCEETEIETKCECECEDDDWSEEEKQEVIEQERQEEKQSQTIDIETGEITTQNINKTSSINKEHAKILFNLLDGKLEVK
ncbi:MAG: Cas9 inhibitor AcrIIA9 family protein [Clostridia bacterium]|nr:Cas9 inhibitor AcrIIA9 family protein [Clostridia bacterium]